MFYIQSKQKAWEQQLPIKSIGADTDVRESLRTTHFLEILANGARVWQINLSIYRYSIEFKLEA